MDIDQIAHVLAGFLTAISSIVSPVLTFIGFLVFALYELDEEWHLRDASYEEIREYGVGFYLGILVLVLTSLV